MDHGGTMFQAVISTVSSGRVRRRAFASRPAAERWVRHVEELASRTRRGLRSIRLEVVGVPPSCGEDVAWKR
jgi:hypothetical protein